MTPWWRGTWVFWSLPGFAEMNLCVEGLDVEDMLCAKEQLWAVQEDLSAI